jgi:hypothetical protein
VKVQSGGLTGTRTVAIADLVRHPDFQVRRQIDAGTVSRYANVIKSLGGADDDPEEAPPWKPPFPPIEVAVVNGAMVVVDGWHRIAAHETWGLTEIEANITPDVSAEDARWTAARANMRHGLPLKPRELREAFRAFVEAGQHTTKDPQGRLGHRSRFKNYAQITRDFGGMSGRTTIQRWMQLDFPRIFQIMRDKADGYPGEGRDKDPDEAAMGRTLAAISQAQANAQGVHDPAARRQIVQAMKDATAAIKSGRPEGKQTGHGQAPPEGYQF